MEQFEYWDSVAFIKTFNHHPYFEEFGKYVKKNSGVLDDGCGYGQSLNELSQQGYTSLYGVDFSEQMIERGKKQYPNLNLIKNNGKYIPFEDNYFDAVNKFKDKYDSYGVFELPEGALLKHHSEKWITQLTEPFQRLWYKIFVVTTMNGNKSNAFQYIGECCK